MAVRAGDLGAVTLRGLRLFALIDGAERELFPADEPVASSDFGSDFGGSLDHITGSDQVVRPVNEPFDPASAWHSESVTGDEFVAVEVEFPRSTDLGFVKVHSGHSGNLHVAQQIQVERGCLCNSGFPGTTGVCGASSALQCAAVGDGNRVFEFVKRVNSGADELVGFPPLETLTLKLALRTQATGTDAWMVVRGLRFFSPQGLEIFPAKITPD